MSYLVESSSQVSSFKSYDDAKKQYNRCKVAILYADGEVIEFKGAFPVAQIIKNLNKALTAIRNKEYSSATTLVQNEITHLRENQIVR